MDIQPQHWEPSESIPDLYWKQFERVASRFTYDPWDEQTLQSRVRDLEQISSARADRSQLADALLAYNRTIGNSEAAVQNIEKLREASALTVIGGQQAGLFTGPLLVIYKAITIIQEASRAAEKLGRDVLPVFWIAGEDHDFDEVNHTYYLTKERKPQKIELSHPGPEKAPVSHIHFSQEAWDEALSQLDEALLPTEFKEDLLRQLNTIANASGTLSDFFARTIAWLFADYGLILIDAQDPAIRALESSFFNQLIRNHKSLNEAFMQGAHEVEQLGFALQAAAPSEAVNLFKIHNEQRLLLVSEQNNGMIHDKNNQVQWSIDELLAEAAEHPEQFSNNVFTRPLMQEFLFPVLSTVLGPGEISYWALLKEGFQQMGMKMPIIVPRIQVTLVEGTVQKQLDKFGWALQDVMVDFEAKKQAWLKAQDELQLDAKFDEVKHAFEQLYQPLLDVAAEVNPGLKNLGDTNKAKILEQIEFMRKRTTGAFEQQFQASLRQMDRVYLSIMPLDKPQERVYNVFMYLNKHGFDWLHELIRTPLSTHTGKYTIYL